MGDAYVEWCSVLLRSSVRIDARPSKPTSVIPCTARRLHTNIVVSVPDADPVLIRFSVFFFASLIHPFLVLS